MQPNNGHTMMPPQQETKLSIAELERLLSLKQLQIDSLLEITQSINNNRNANELFRIYEFILQAQMGVERLLVFHHNTQWDIVCRSKISKEIANTIVVERDLMPYQETTFLQNSNNTNLQGFDIVVPIYHKQEALVFLLLGNIKTESPKELHENIRFIQIITSIIVVAIENKRLFKQRLQQDALERDLDVAQKVQNMLIPSSLPYNQHVQMCAFYMPHRNVGGDYYDYVPLNPNEFITCMADVSGKGIPAALLMSNVQAVVRTLAHETNNLKEIVVKLNRTLLDITGGDRFITLFIAKYNLQTREFTYINAGHNPPFMIANNTTQLLDKGCTLIGVFDKLPKIQQTTITLPPNTVIISYTDGLTDLENNKNNMFGVDRLQNLVEQYAHLDMNEFNQILLNNINLFRGSEPYSDDISVLNYRLV